MLCGFRALADYHNKEGYIRSISALLCAPEEELVAAVQSLKEECTSYKQKLTDKQFEILAFKAAAIPAEQSVVCLFEDELEGEAPRHLVNLVLAQEKELCIIFYGAGSHEYRYVIGSKVMDVRALAKALNQAFDGRGGGKPEMAQGLVQGGQDEIAEWLQEEVKKLRDG